jgi:shikimate dehydrogenase
MIHNGAFKRLGWNAVYLAFEIENLEEALRGIRGLGVKGMSVTLPFKADIIPFLDKVEGVAKKIKAVNTIVNRRGRLTGYNTDCEGALEALEEKMNLKGKKVVLLGAGGAARAIGFGLRERDCQLIIANRSQDRGEALSRELKCSFLTMSSLARMKAGELEADVMINATSLGMYPRDGETPIPKRLLDERMTVMDIVYEPLETRLLGEAKERGCLAINGLEMLVRQGAAQFEIWTGTRPEIAQIKKDLRRVLEKKPGRTGSGELKIGKR